MELILSETVPIPEDPLKEMLETLDITRAARTREDIFTGPSNYMHTGRVYGGQFVGQALVAAAHTVQENRPVHSMHAYFLRPGDIHQPITYSGR